MANQNHLRAGCRIILDDIAFLYRSGEISANEKSTMVIMVKEALKSGDSNPLMHLVESMKRETGSSVYDEILAMM